MRRGGLPGGAATLQSLFHPRQGRALPAASGETSFPDPLPGEGGTPGALVDRGDPVLPGGQKREREGETLPFGYIYAP